MRFGRPLALVLLWMTSLAAACSRPTATPPPAATTPAPVVQATAPAPVEQAPGPAPVTPRLIQPDPTGRYIAESAGALRILDYGGQAVAAPTFPGDPVQDLFWSPRGDLLVVVTGKPDTECCRLVKEARYWLVTLPAGAVRELTGLPQQVVFSWPADEKSLYVLDNWRRIERDMNALGERIQRYDLASGALTLLQERQSQLYSVDEMPGGDLWVGQYGGGGHGFYYRLPVGQSQMVKAAPFHASLSPDGLWAVETNVSTDPWLAVASVRTGEVTEYRPNPAWPRITELTRMSDPVWAPDSRWLLYQLFGDVQELRFWDRTQAEPDRVVKDAEGGAWLPGPGPQALLFRQEAAGLVPWRYDVTAARYLSPVGPASPDSRFCGGQVLTRANTAAYITCSAQGRTAWLIDLEGGLPPRSLAVDADARILSLSADGKSVALDTGGGTLTFLRLGE